jgi:hypothetical protein
MSESNGHCGPLTLVSAASVEREKMTPDQLRMFGALPGAVLYFLSLSSNERLDVPLGAARGRVVGPLAEARRNYLSGPSATDLQSVGAKIAESEAELLEAEKAAAAAMFEAGQACAALEDPAAHEEAAEKALRRAKILEGRIAVLRPLHAEKAAGCLRDLRRQVFSRRRELHVAALAEAERVGAELTAAIQPHLQKLIVAQQIAELLKPSPSGADFASHLTELPHGLAKAPDRPARENLQRVDYTPGPRRAFRVELPYADGKGNVFPLMVLLKDDTGMQHRQDHLNISALCSGHAFDWFKHYNGICATKVEPRITELRGPGVHVDLVAPDDPVAALQAEAEAQRLKAEVSD